MFTEIHEREIGLIQEVIKQYYDCGNGEVLNSIVRTSYLAAIDNDLNHIVQSDLNEAFEKTKQFKSSEHQFSLQLYALHNMGTVNESVLGIERKLSRSIGYNDYSEINKFYDHVCVSSQAAAKELLGNLNLSICDSLDLSFQTDITKNFKGSKLQPLGSMHLTELCSPTFATHRVEDKGYSVIATLVNPITSHALTVQADLARKSFVKDYSEFIEENIDELVKTKEELKESLLSKENDFINNILK